MASAADTTLSPEAALEAAVDAALEEAGLRQKALELACGRYRKINWTGDANRITALADSFYQFLRRGRPQ